MIDIIDMAIGCCSAILDQKMLLSRQYVFGQCAVLSIFISTRGRGQAVSENIHLNNLAPASGIVGYNGSDSTILSINVTLQNST